MLDNLKTNIETRAQRLWVKRAGWIIAIGALILIAVYFAVR